MNGLHFSHRGTASALRSSLEFNYKEYRVREEGDEGEGEVYEDDEYVSTEYAIGSDDDGE